MRTDWTISACCHLVVVGAALVSFSPARLPVPHVDSIAVNIVTDTPTSMAAKGVTTAQDTQKPFVERIGEQQTVDNPAAKIAPKEVTASTDATPPPPPPEPKQAAKQKPEPKRDLIAEALKKDAAAKKVEQKKADAKKADAKIPTPPKRPPRPPTPQNQPKFDPREMQALLDKRTPQRKEAKGATLSDSPIAGTKRGTAAQSTQDEFGAFIRRLVQLWNPPTGAQNYQEIMVVIRISLNPDGTLAAPPRVLTSGQSPRFMASRDNAVRAVLQGAPFTMLRPETYEKWKVLDVTFDPRMLVEG